MVAPPGPAPGRLRPPPLHRPLLDAIVADALDPAYADAAARRVERPPRSRAAAAALLLVGGLALGLTLGQGRADAPVAEQTRNALLGDVQVRSAAVEDLARQVEALREETTRLQQAALAGTDEGRAVASRRADLATVAGETGVRGPGLAVEVDDAPGSGAGRGSSEQRPDQGTAVGRVRDRDLQDVVNALWAAGAEAVSVGGIRLSPTTAIRTAGETILADYRPITAPYVVLAVGDPERLPDAFRDAAVGVLTRLRDQASPVRVTTRDDLDLPAAGSNDLRLATPLDGASAAPTASGPGPTDATASTPTATPGARP